MESKQCGNIDVRQLVLVLHGELCVSENVPLCVWWSYYMYQLIIALRMYEERWNLMFALWWRRWWCYRGSNLRIKISYLVDVTLRLWKSPHGFAVITMTLFSLSADGKNSVTITIFRTWTLLMFQTIIYRQVWKYFFSQLCGERWNFCCVYLEEFC